MSEKPNKIEFETGREMLNVQGRNGNWDFDPYMHGLYNGMEFMLSLIEQREPEFRDAPKKWLREGKLKRFIRKITFSPKYRAVPSRRNFEEDR